MSQYFPTPISNHKIDLINYATKKGINDITHVDTQTLH